MMPSMNPDPLSVVADFVKASAAPKRVAVIFDLDSTLFCVSPRTQTILRQLGEDVDFRGRFPEAAAALSTIDVKPTEWGIRAVLERTKVQGTLEMFIEIRKYWRERFFTSRYLDQDVIYPSANDYVRHVHALGAHILYLTGRNEGSMREGTLTALHRWGFPLFAPEDLIMKPSEIQSDDAYKVRVLKDLQSRFEQILFFENEPVIIEQIRNSLPEIRIIFVDSVHSGRAANPQGLPTIGMTYQSDWIKKS